MIEVLLLSFVGALTVLGLTEVFYCLRKFLKRPKENIKLYSVVFLDGENLGQQVDYIISESLWHGEKLGEYILAVIPEKSSLHNKTVIEENYNIRFCALSEAAVNIRKMGEDFYAKRKRYSNSGK